ncbi:MAG: ABC transporter ATP-binding protein [Armatimonadota bacterium]|nr:ABC transporter ATP-binding protein [Armatimonadota bacterium]MDR7486443.1 ABC transporter ATP-binding protein [Armatimonadota bacterium]MDR7532209.1 ABC transporter ATP-binding protein [Armatimonadota bacterium]MDR7537216.1 ABC transporter ATP-binding protein [Armatimonadota bacterium]
MLTITDVDVFYGETQALWGVSLRVEAGELVALVGANGAGKTTLLRAISGLARVTRGAIALQGTRLTGRPPYAIARLGVTHVPEGRRLFLAMTVEENLQMGAAHRVPPAERVTLLRELFDLFPVLRERRRQVAGTLSGGEQQMLAIGRALMARPRLLMLDEPSLGLAPRIVEQIMHTVAEIRRRGVTVLLVEQNVHHALRLADRAYVLENGRVVLEGTGHELLQSPQVRASYLGAAR